MSSWGEWINSWPWWAPLSFVGTALSLLLAWYFYKRSTRRRKPRFLVRSLTLIKQHLSEIPKLSIQHDGRPVESMAVTEVTFWNGGKEVVNPVDVAEKDPVRIICNPKLKVFDAKVAGTSGKVNDFSVSKADKKNEWRVGFDYIGAGDGLTVRLMHGLSDEPSVRVAGTLKDGSEIKREHPEFYAGFLDGPTARKMISDLKEYKPPAKGSFNTIIHAVAVFLTIGVVWVATYWPLQIFNSFREGGLTPPNFSDDFFEE